MKITFEPFQERHFCLLLQWLKTPHVKEFWIEPEEEAELRKKYLDKLKQRGINSQIILLDDKEIGYIQSYQANEIGAGWWPDVDPGVFGVDQFIGEPSLIGKGIGPKVILEFIKLVSNDPQVKEIIADPDPINFRAIKAYEKVGFTSSGIIQTPNGQAMLMRLRVRE
jgi:aminoglycoside 6'-N-acetyltransferase-1b/aminoglycoside 6'-N-acetyltransferase-2